jgi:hypothetical protein
MPRLVTALIAVVLLASGALIALGGRSGDGHSAEAAQKFLRARLVTGTGDLKAAVRRFRQLLGPNNGGAPVGNPKGRREINWDSVPDEFASPNALPADFFNAAVAPRARGAVLSTPGTNVAVSADSSNPAGAGVRFGNINPGYASQFTTFSAERLFSPIGSNVVNLTFRVPGTNKRAVVKAFGAVYTDIDKAKNTAFEYFSPSGRSLGKFSAPVSKGKRSFLGAVFVKRLRVARVRIRYGSGPLGPSDSTSYDAAVMDDFFYSEPRPAG